MPQNIKKESTRPIVQFPFTIENPGKLGESGQFDSRDFHQIAQGLYFARYIQEAVPGVIVKIYKLTTDEATLHIDPGDGRRSEVYRFGLSSLSDGVRYSNGRKYKNTFAEFIDELREGRVVVDEENSFSSVDEENSSSSVD